MKTSTKIIAAAAAAVALGAGGLVFAHQGQGGMGQMGGNMGHGMGMHGGMHGATDPAARLAAVKSELQITPAQEPAWQQFESVLRQHDEARQALRSRMHAQMSDPSAAAGIDRDAQHESMMQLHQAERAERDAARQALYAVLTPEQKTLADQRLGNGAGRGHGRHLSMRAPAN